jgi:hypothetical protein
VVDLSQEAEAAGARGSARRGQALNRCQCNMRGTLSVNSGIGASKRVPSSATS